MSLSLVFKKLFVGNVKGYTNVWIKKSKVSLGKEKGTTLFEFISPEGKVSYVFTDKNDYNHLIQNPKLIVQIFKDKMEIIQELYDHKVFYFNGKKVEL